MGREQAIPRTSYNIKADLNISFEEAYSGTKTNFTAKIPGREKASSISLNIPAGCAEGTKLKLKGQGKPLPTGGNGDLIIEVHIKPHEYFEVEGKNVIVNVPVTFSEAVLGEKVEIPTPDGKRVRIKVPKGAQNGTKLTIKGKGMPKKLGTYGNLIARINVVIPQDLSKTQVSKLKAYAKVESKEVRPW